MSRVGVVVTDTHVRPEGLLEAIAAAAAGRGHLSVVDGPQPLTGQLAAG